MADVKGKFLADFSSFYDAVKKAEVSLTSLETGAGKVEKSLNRTANAFQGSKIIQDATLAVEAVTRIGGATALTEKEQAKLNALVTEAIAKYTALGKVAPQELRDMAAATTKVHTESAKLPSTFGNITSSLSSLAGAFGIAFSAQALIGFGKEVFATAGKIDDLSAKLGISAEAVQGLGAAAALGGSDIETIGKAILEMNKRLAEGDKSTVGALKAVGVNFQELKNQSPEEAFYQIADAIKGIENPMEQARVAFKLFGEAGLALLPAIQEDIRKTADATSKMSNDTVKALANAEDAWTKFRNALVTTTGTALASTISFFDQVERRFDELVVKTGKWYGLAPPKGFTPAGDRIPAPAAPAPTPPPGLGLTPGEQKSAEEAQRKAEEAARKQDAINQKIFAGLTQRAAMYEKQQTLLDASTTALQKYVAEHRKLNEVISATIPAEATEAYTGYGRSLQHVSSVLGENTTALLRQQTQLEKNATEAKRFFATLPTAAQEFDRLGAAVANFGGLLGSQLVAQLGLAMSAFSRVKAAVADVRGGFDKLTSGGGLTSILGGFTSIVSGIGGIVAAAQSAIAIGKALFGLFDRNKGRDLVVDFAESMGGFDALHAQLLTLGAEGEALWVKLTQGVGRNNPEQARKAIEEVTKALADKEEASEDAATATEEEARATIETASEAARALEALAPKILENEQAWRAWGDGVTSHIQRVADALSSLAFPAPGAAGASAGGGGGETSFTVTLDGKKLAAGLVPHIPGVVKGYGLA